MGAWWGPGREADGDSAVLAISPQPPPPHSPKHSSRVFGNQGVGLATRMAECLRPGHSEHQVALYALDRSPAVISHPLPCFPGTVASP